MTNKELKSIFKKIPILQTERLIIRKIALQDTNDMFEYSCRLDVTKYLL